jgi:hypothetical protein
MEYDIGLCFTSETTFPKMLGYISSISKLKIKDEYLLKEIEDLLKKLKEIEQNRNMIIHATYLIAGSKIKRAKISAKQSKGLMKMLYDIDANEIEGYVTEISEAKIKTVNLASKLKLMGLVSNQFFS